MGSWRSTLRKPGPTKAQRKLGARAASKAVEAAAEFKQTRPGDAPPVVVSDKGRIWDHADAASVIALGRHGGGWAEIVALCGYPFWLDQGTPVNEAALKAWAYSYTLSTESRNVVTSQLLQAITRRALNEKTIADVASWATEYVRDEKTGEVVLDLDGKPKIERVAFTLKDSSDLTPEEAAAIESVQVLGNGTIKITMRDAASDRTLLARITGLQAPTVEDGPPPVNTTDLQKILNGSMDRLAALIRDPAAKESKMIDITPETETAR